MQPYAQTLPQIVVVDDISPKTPSVPEQDINTYLASLWHGENTPCEDEAEDEPYFSLHCDEQEWRKDYYASIQL